MARFGFWSGLHHPIARRQIAMAAALTGFGLLAYPSAGRADVISDVNGALENIIAYTSTSLIDGPPEVAQEIAMVDGAMYNAVNAAGGGNGVTAQAAALSAAVTVMNNLYGSGSLYQTYQGQTGATYYGAGGAGSSIPGAAGYATAYANALVGPTTLQMNSVAAQIGTIQTELNTVNNGAGATIGATAGNAMITSQSGSGATAASLATINTPYTQLNSNPGTYVPPANRPAMTPTWGTVTPVGTSNATVQAVVNKSVAAPPPITSAAYASQVLQTECQGAGVALPGAIAAACGAANLAPQTVAQATAALFWNDPGGTAQPPGEWLLIADSAAGATSLGLLQHAQEDSLVGEALDAAGVAAWSVKYHNNLWRPTTAIQDCNNWNSYFTTCDHTWKSLIATPPHPDYIAGHPAFSGAAATVLDNFFGTSNIAVTTSSQAYCNGASNIFDANANIIGCNVGGTSTDGGQTYTGGTSYYVSNGFGADGCNNGVTNDSGAVNPNQATVLNSDYTANANYNGSPLVCPISQTFDSFDDASSGDLGASFSRVVGGIHTPMAIDSGLAAGNAIGEQVASDNNIPEPGSLALLSLSIGAFGVIRRRRMATRAA